MVFTTSSKGDEKGEPASLWDLLKTAGEEFPLREQRIAEKKSRLEAMGVQIDTSHIKRPENPENIDYSDVKMSMWEIIQLAQQNISAYQEYLDKLEETYDDAIAK
ncbi:MAG: hypothetical protein JSW28_07885, partial [Thermoplasmata archaeon]